MTPISSSSLSIGTLTKFGSLQVWRRPEDGFALDVSRLGRDIDDMNRLWFSDAAQRRSPTRSLWSALPELGECRRDAEHRSRKHAPSLETEQHAEAGLADAHRDSPAWPGTRAASSPGELEMTRSTSAVAVCCSSASRKLACARLHLFKQPHVLDRDHRLVGEDGYQIDLFCCKWLQQGSRPFSRFHWKREVRLREQLVETAANLSSEWA